MFEGHIQRTANTPSVPTKHLSMTASQSLT